MLKVLVFAEVGPRGLVRESAAALIGLAGRLGHPIAAAATVPANSDAVADQLGKLGAQSVVVGLSDHVGSVVSAAEVEAMARAVEAFSPDVVLISNTVEGREVAGRIAVRTGAAVMADVVGLRAESGKLIGVHSVFGGRYTTESTTSGGMVIVTVRPGSIDDRASAVEPTVEKLELQPQASPAATISEHREDDNSATGRPELRSASIVVAGGRGLGSRENFELTEELAHALGAAVGASRAAVDAGFAAQNQQVGQTGTTVSPDLYVALGISGAIQHRVGMQTAKTIVAINSDPSAPIFDIADFGIVGDALAIVPQVVRALEARSAHGA